MNTRPKGTMTFKTLRGLLNIEGNVANTMRLTEKLRYETGDVIRCQCPDERIVLDCLVVDTSIHKVSAAIRKHARFSHILIDEPMSIKDKIERLERETKRMYRSDQLKRVGKFAVYYLRPINAKPYYI